MQREFAVTPPPAVTLAVEGGSMRFPVGRIFCIGRNYAAHAVEMGHDPDREPPFFFLKPATAISADGVFRRPAEVGEVHHEVEMVVALARGGANIAVADALNCVFGYGVGLDMTLRDVQAEAKRLSRPWDVAKGFDGSAPCSTLATVEQIGHPAAGVISLAVNGEVRQTGDLNQMIWKVPEIIAELSRHFTLLPGDLIMTGTPAGVGPLVEGDAVAADIAGVAHLELKVVGRD
jgi:fumarylpyruvate hydrolase